MSPAFGGMSCPKCGSDDDTVVDSRKQDYTVMRRRRCNRCKTRWQTFEVTAEDYDLLMAMKSSSMNAVLTKVREIALLLRDIDKGGDG